MPHLAHLPSLDDPAAVKLVLHGARGQGVGPPLGAGLLGGGGGRASSGGLLPHPGRDGDEPGDRVVVLKQAPEVDQEGSDRAGLAQVELQPGVLVAGAGDEQGAFEGRTKEKSN